MCGMGRGIRMAESMGAISKVGDRDMMISSKEEDDATTSSVKKTSSKKTKSKYKTSKSAVGANPLDKSNTGLEIQRV